MDFLYFSMPLIDLFEYFSSSSKSSTLFSMSKNESLFLGIGYSPLIHCCLMKSFDSFRWKGPS